MKDVRERLLEHGLNLSWTSSAKKYLSERLEELAKIHNFEFNKIGRASCRERV